MTIGGYYFTIRSYARQCVSKEKPVHLFSTTKLHYHHHPTYPIITDISIINSLSNKLQ